MLKAKDLHLQTFMLEDPHGQNLVMAFDTDVNLQCSAIEIDNGVDWIQPPILPFNNLINDSISNLSSWAG
jgi:hypothetical protein